MMLERNSRRHGRSFSFSSTKRGASARGLLALTAAVAASAMSLHSARADIFGNSNGGTDLSMAGSWTDESTPPSGSTVPGSGDIARFDSNSAGGTFTLDIPTSWLGISIANPTAAVTIGNAGDTSNGGTLTLGASGIDMSAATQNLTVGDPFALGASQTWNIASSRTFTVATPMNLGTAALTLTGSGNVSVNNNTYFISGAGSIVKDGSGTLTLGATNSYTGTTTINNGTLSLAMNTAFPTPTGLPSSVNILPTGTTLIAGGGTVLNTGGGSGSGTTAWIETFGGLSIQAGATTFNESRGSSSRVIDVFSAINRSAGATVNFVDCYTTSSGANNANSGGYRASNASGSGIVNGVIPYITYTTTVTSSSPGNGAGGLPLVANSPLATSWYVPAGTGGNGTALASFNVSTASALGTGSTSNVDVQTSVAVPTGTTVNTLRFNSGNSNTLTIASGDTLVDGTGGILITNAYANHQGHITGGTLEGGNPGGGSANDLMFIDYDDPDQGTNSKFTVDSVIADNTTNANPNGTATSLTKSGIGLLVLTNTANTYTGNTYINGGIVNIAGEGSSFGTLGAIPTSTVANNVTFSGGTLQMAASFNLNSKRGFTLADKGGSFDTNSFSSTYAGTITGTGSFTKLGVGTLTLSDANTYTGNTNVSAGMLSVLNSSGSATGSGNVIISGNAYLTGSGAISGGVTLAAGATNGSGGHIDPGNAGVGTITVGSLTMNTGSAADLEFANDSSYDQVKATNLTINGGGINLFQPGSTVLPYDSNGTHTYDLFSYTGTLTGAATNLAVFNPVTGFTYTFGTIAGSGGNPGYVTLTTSGTASAVISQWNTLANNQVWSNTTNWTAGVPHNAGDIASFLTIAGQTGPIALTLDAAESVGELNFNDAFSYTITASGGGALTLDNGGSAASINDLGGIHTITAPITLNSNTTITTTNTTDVITLNGNIGGAGTLTIGTTTTGSFGTVILTGTNSYADPTTINAGNTLQIGTNSSTGSLGGTNLTDNGAFIVNRSTAYTISGVISGSGSLTQEGSGTLLLTNTNSYTGFTTITAGTLQLGAAGAIGTGAATVAGGATLDLNGFSASIGALSGAGTVDDIAGGGTATLTIGGTTGTGTFSGVIKNTTGTVNLIKVGTGTETLSGTNTYSGYTNIGTDDTGTSTPSAGTVVVTGVIGGGPTQGAITVGDNASLTITNGSVTASALTFGSQVNTVVSITGTSILNVSTGLLAAANDNGNGTGYLSLTGGTVTANSVTVGRTTTNDGGTIITGGVSTTSGIYVNGGTLNINTTLGIGNSSATNSSANMRMDAGSVTVGGTTDITLGATTGRFSVLDLSGGTFTSNDTTGAGILIGGGNFATPDAELLIRGTAVVNANTITFGTAAQTGGTLALEMTGGTLNLGAGGLVNASGTTPTINLGLSTVATAPLITATAPWSSSLAMTLNNSNTGASPTFRTANASGGAVNISLSGALGGNGGLTATGAGVLTLSGVSGYAGNTNVAGGTLTISPTGSISSSTVTVAAGATFNADGTNYFGLNTNTALTSNGIATFGGNMGNGSPATALVSSITIGSTGSVLLVDPGVGNHANRTVLVTSSLSFSGSTGAWTGKLDLAGNDAVVHGGNLANLTNQAAQGYNGGKWNGSGGVISSTATVDTTHLTAVGVIQNDDGTNTSTALYGSFDNQSVSDSDILLKYTYYGDANLDGKVDGSDYSRIDNAYEYNLSNPGSPLTGWFNGDFNYDGVINGSDYTLIDNTFNIQGATLADAIASPNAEIAGTTAGSSSAVPEPTMLRLTGVAALSLLGRRRRSELV